jgi:hypothetical protein
MLILMPLKQRKVKNVVFLDVCRVALERNDVSKERIATIFRATKNGELGKRWQ